MRTTPCLTITHPATGKTIRLTYAPTDSAVIHSVATTCEVEYDYSTYPWFLGKHTPTAHYCPEAFTGPEQAVAWAHRLLDPEPLRPLEEIGGDMRTFTLAEVDAAFETVAGKED